MTFNVTSLRGQMKEKIDINCSNVSVRRSDRLYSLLDNRVINEASISLHLSKSLHFSQANSAMCVILCVQKEVPIF